MHDRPALLHEFLPASEIFRVAEAVLRVFQRLGDYQHKQRNRMKFMIKTLGWTRWREEYDRELTGCRLRGEVPTLEIDPPAGESTPDWVKDASPSVGADRVARRRRGTVNGPGHHADRRAGACRPATRRTRGGARPTCGRRSSSAT